MKFTNIKQLLINFKGGGLINFPFKHLKEVDIDGDSDEQSGGEGGGSAELTKLDTIKNYVNILYDKYNIEFDVIEETSTREEEITDENEEPTGEVITITQKKYKFVPKTDIPRVYLNNNKSGKTSLNYNSGLRIYSINSNNFDVSGISKITLNDTELTVQQLIHYDIVQVGTAIFPINAPNYNFNGYDGYLEYIDWVRNNIEENVEIPILLLGEPTYDGATTRVYHGDGFINTQLELNGNYGYYSQVVFKVIES